MQQVITVGIAGSVQPVLVLGDPNSMAPYANDTVKRAADIVEDVNVTPITYPLGRCRTMPDVVRTHRTPLSYAIHPVRTVLRRTIYFYNNV